MEERVELETVRVVLGGFANTSLVPENKRPASNQARSIDSFPAALLTVPEGFRELQQSGPLLLHLHGLTEYLGTSADSTGMFQIIENHPGIKIRCTCSMGLCKFLALAPHVMKGHVILTRFKDQRTTNILGCASLISHVWSQKSDSD